MVGLRSPIPTFFGGHMKDAIGLLWIPAGFAFIVAFVAALFLTI
jgi:hypothetical protein